MDWEFGTNRRNMAESKNGVHAMCVCNVGMKLSAVSSLVVHKRLWSSNYISNCIFTLRKLLRNVIGAPETFVDD